MHSWGETPGYFPWGTLNLDYLEETFYALLRITNHGAVSYTVTNIFTDDSVIEPPDVVDARVETGESDYWDEDLCSNPPFSLGPGEDCTFFIVLQAEKPGSFEGDVILDLEPGGIVPLGDGPQKSRTRCKQNI